MNTATLSGPNGRAVRKSLAQQIDRLDGVLDGLADNLNEAVAAAVKAAVQQAVCDAVQAAVIEVLTNPQLQTRLRQVLHAGQPQPPRSRIRPRLAALGGWLTRLASSVPQRIISGLRSVYQRLQNWFGQTAQAIEDHCREVQQVAKTVLRVSWFFLSGWAPLVQKLRRPFGVGAVVGLTMGIGTYIAGPIGAALASGLLSLALAVLTMSLWPLCRMLQNEAWAADR